MSAGRRNRLVTIQRRVTSNTNTGSRDIAFETFAQVYAEKRDAKTGASKDTMSATQYPILRVEWVIRYLPGITPSMRVVYEGETWEIINIADDSFRRDYKVLLCELRGNGSTSGGLTCQPATYQNAAIDPSFTQTIQSGAVFTADPITVTDVDGSTRSNVPNEDITCAFIEIEVFDTDGNLIETVTEYPDDGRITVPAAGADAVYSNGGAFSVNIPPGDTYTAPEITVTDVDGSTRSSLPNIGVVCEWKVIQVRSTDGVLAAIINSYPSGGNADVLSHGYYDSDGTLFEAIPHRRSLQLVNANFESIVNDTPNSGKANITIEVDVPVQNSNGDTVGSNVDDLLNPHALPDVSLTDDDGNQGSFPMPTALVIDGVVDTASYAAGTLTITPASAGCPALIYQRSLFRGVPQSYEDYDLGWQVAQDTYNYGNPQGTRVGLDYTDQDPFYHVSPNNAFGNNLRYTDSEGNGAADGLAQFGTIDWANDRPNAIPYYVIAHLTGLGWIIAKVGYTEQWATALATAHNFSHGGFSDYRMPSTGEVEDVLNTADFPGFYQAGNIFTRDNNFVVSGGNETSMWLNSTHVGNTTQANTLNSSGDISRAGKTSTANRATYAVRTHYP